MTHTEPSAEHVRGEGGVTSAHPPADERERRGLGQRLMDKVMGEDDRERGRGRDADPAAAGYEHGATAGQEQGGAVSDPTRSLADHVAPTQEPGSVPDRAPERTDRDPSVVEERQPAVSVPEQDRGPSTGGDEAGSSPTDGHGAQSRTEGERVVEERPAAAAEDERATATGRDDVAPATDGAETSTATAAAADSEPRERLIPKQRAEEYGGRWDRLKGDFVDEPRRAVAQADALVGELLDELQELFSGQRRDLERDLSNDEASTEDLRLALRRYRSFFDRLLSF